MNSDDSAVEHTWKARSVQPVVLLYVAAIFLGFVGLAHFVLHTAEGVMALAMTGIGSVVTLVPNVLARIEYRASAAGLAKRKGQDKKEKEFKDLFAWDELSHVVPTSSGFKFYKRLEEVGSLTRFWRYHVVTGFAGEIHVEKEGRAQVEKIIAGHGVPISASDRAARIEG